MLFRMTCLPPYVHGELGKGLHVGGGRIIPKINRVRVCIPLSPVATVTFLYTPPTKVTTNLAINPAIYSDDLPTWYTVVIVTQIQEFTSQDGNHAWQFSSGQEPETT